MRPAQRHLLLACFLTSGATSLTFEVAWSKQLSYLLGNGLHAVSTVVAAFMAGLALGSWLASRYGERVASPVAWYGGLQVAVGLFGALSIPLFRHAEPLFLWVYHQFGLGHGPFLAVRFLAVFLLMALPVTLMGVTLPLVVGAFARSRESYTYDAGLLYGVNTLGAVVGTLGSGFLLLPALGLWKACLVAGLLDAAAGVVALVLARRLTELRPAPGAADVGREVAKRPRGGDFPVRSLAGWTPAQWAIGCLFGFSGAVAMFYEIGWFRLLGLVMGPSVVAFSSMLGIYLAGIGLGSALAARWVERVGSTGWSLMAGLELLLALVGCAGFLYFNDLPGFYAAIYRASGSGPWLSHLGLAAAVVLPPCLLMGALFPASVRTLREAGPRRSPEANVGRLYLLNTAGGIAGSLAAGFWAIPSLGLGVTLRAAAICSAAIGAGLLALAPASARMRFLVAPAAFAACAGIAVIVPDLNLIHLNLGSYRGLYTRREAGPPAPETSELLFYREGLNAPVAVFNTDGGGSLHVTGKADASTGDAERITQSLAGHLPILFSRGAARVAVVGYGSGMSAGAVLTHPEVRSVDVMEIEEAVIEASPYFESFNGAALRDPRTRLIVEDARIFLTYTDRTYDVMALEPSNPWMAGVSNLFTTDFYRIARSRLVPGGILCCWIQTYESSEETFRVMLASVREVFPHVALFHNRADTLLLCSTEPIRVDWGTLAGRMGSPEASRSLRSIGIREPAHLWTYFRACDSGLDGFMAGIAQRNTDDNVWLEHHAVRQLLRSGTSDAVLRLNAALVGLGAGSRLAAFESLCPGTPREKLLGEGVRYLFGAEPILEKDGRMMDPRKDARVALLSGLREELAGGGHPGGRDSLEDWVAECEAYRAARFQATAQLVQPEPRDPRAKYQFLEGILRSAPDLPMANNAMADFLITEGRDYEASEPYYLKASEDWFSPNCYGARINLGNIALIRSKYEGKDLWGQAEAYYRSAIAWNPFRPRAYDALAQLYLLRGDTESAGRAVEEGLRFNPGAGELADKLEELRKAGGPRTADGAPPRGTP